MLRVLEAVGRGMLRGEERRAPSGKVRAASFRSRQAAPSRINRNGSGCSAAGRRCNSRVLRACRKVRGAGGTCRNQGERKSHLGVPTNSWAGKVDISIQTKF